MVRASLAVVSCPTSFASDAPAVVATRGLPNAASVAVPASQHAHPNLEIYAASNGSLAVVGAGGSACAATVAEDGSGSLAVVSPSESADLDASVTSDTPPAQGIFVSDTGGCATCLTRAACIVSPSPSKVLHAFGLPCPHTTLDGDVIRHVSPTVAYFEDRSGTLGVAIYDQGAAATGHPTQYLATCSLPASERSVCETMQYELQVRGATLGQG